MYIHMRWYDCLSSISQIADVGYDRVGVMHIYDFVIEWRFAISMKDGNVFAMIYRWLFYSAKELCIFYILFAIM
jgi:ABC-type antimicrobial peptide transport system permease subunit